MRTPSPLAILALAVTLAGPAAAQVLGGAGLPQLPGGGLPGPGLPRVESLPRPLPDRTPRLPDRLPKATPPVTDVPQVVEGAAETVRGVTDASLADVRRLAAQRLLRDHADLVEPDDRGRPVVRGEILALEPSPTGLERLRKAGFVVRDSGDLAALGLRSAVLSVPRGMSAVEAVRRLKALDPNGEYDFNHLYQEGGAVGASVTLAPAAAVAGEARGLRIGLVDGGVAAHPSLANARLVQRGFAPGGTKPSAHATAVASLMAGQRGPFRGAAPGATLMVADVYGATPAGGSAQAMARGLAWLAENRVPVINVSLVGPSNTILAAAVRALVARGHLVVAAVGNDGPSAPPLYPAAYPGVISVTGVDARRQVLPEAGRAGHVDFAAPGAQMAAASSSGGYATVRGTSFAAPLAAGKLATLLRAPDPGAARRAVAALGREASDVGPRGTDPIYGRGLVAAELRIDPAAVGARAAFDRRF